MGSSAIMVTKGKMRLLQGNLAKVVEEVRVNLRQHSSLPRTRRGLTPARFLPSFVPTSTASPWPSCSAAQPLPASNMLPAGPPLQTALISHLVSNQGMWSGALPCVCSWAGCECSRVGGHSRTLTWRREAALSRCPPPLRPAPRPLRAEMWPGTETHPTKNHTRYRSTN